MFCRLNFEQAKYSRAVGYKLLNTETRAVDGNFWNGRVTGIHSRTEDQHKSTTIIALETKMI